MLVIGHRGASGHALENTLDAFERCVAPSPPACDGVELDVHTTADGELVVHHDPALADGRLLHELTAAEVAEARLKDGSGIPTLAEALVVLSPIEVFIEAKGVSIHGLGRLRALMAGHPFPERLHVHALDHRATPRRTQTATGVLPARRDGESWALLIAAIGVPLYLAGLTRSAGPLGANLLGLALVVLPATIGLVGNPSLSQSVPLQIPAHAQLATSSESSSPTSRPTDASTEPGDDNSADHGTDDNGPDPVDFGDDTGGTDDRGGGGQDAPQLQGAGSRAW